MKQHIEYLSDYFMDYDNAKHYFTIVAVSDYVEGKTEIESDEDNCFDRYIIKKKLSLGVSFCNPCDKFDEQKGVEIALDNLEPVMFVPAPGIINTTMVQALLRQEADFIKKHPESFIEGYTDTANRHAINAEMRALNENFTGAEKMVVEMLQKDIASLDNVFNYVTWWSNQQHGQKQS